nr:DnaJ domain-containing protein [Chloroflexota bacterium]
MSGMQHIPDPYRVLGVQRAATPLQIKSAHRNLAKRYHPDAPEADTGRFLAIQEAYSLLSDPLRRRDWDARHAPGPVRAGEGTTRGRGRGAAGRWTREDTEVGTRRGARPPRRSPASKADSSGGTNGTPRDGSTASESTGYDVPDDAPSDPHQPRRGPDRWSASGRDPSTRSYTWSAEGVPWWEDFPGPRPPKGGDTPGARSGRDRAAPSQTGRHSRSDPAPGGSTTPRREGAKSPADRGRGTDRPPPSGAASTGDPDVYSRSSGAAWSSAARRYFRQADSDLPSRGVFRREGTQFVTGARARTAADTDARRTAPRPAAPPRTSNVPAPERARTTSEGVLRPRPGPLGPRQAFHHEPPAGPTGSPAAATADALPNASRRGVLTARVTSVTSTDLRPGGVRTGSIES